MRKLKAHKNMPQDRESEEILHGYSTSKNNKLLFIGIFEKGVTVYAQQIRALNLAHALIKGKKLNGKRVAIVGGGVTGLTLTAALIKKGVDTEITLFEKRANLIPLQSGSDSRWIHPRIYDWPKIGSEMSSANLPIMNWVAGRASDVAVDLIKKWKKLISEAPRKKLKVFINTNYLRIKAIDQKFNIEWIGTSLDEFNAVNDLKRTNEKGAMDEFDFVILCTGYGIERGVETEFSYWRNETLGQPYLGHGKAVFLVSGSGDGAVIDLLRLRVANFRQDRILNDIFDRTTKKELLDIHTKYLDNQNIDLYAELDAVCNNVTFKGVLESFSRRLRSDTEVIYRTRNKTISQLFKDDVKMSFQNRVLFFLLFKLGGFTYACDDEDVLIENFNIPSKRVIIRHGSDTGQLLFDILGIQDDDQINEVLDSIRGQQTPEPKWAAGYFDKPEESDGEVSDELKESWQQEYLPSATQLIATGFCSSVAGFLQGKCSGADVDENGLRVTLHRVIYISNKPYLQQACNYAGGRDRNKNTSARTFKTDIGFIGLAYKNKRICVANNKAEISKEIQDNGLAFVDVRSIDEKVKSIIAVPIMEAGTDANKTVLGILFADAFEDDLFKFEVSTVLEAMCKEFAAQLSYFDESNEHKLEMINNHTFSTEQNAAINFDYSGFI